MTTKRSVFVDTAGWIALIHRGDVLNQQATKIYKSFGKIRRVTTDAVIIETCNSFRKASTKPLAVAFLEKIKLAHQLGILEIVQLTEGVLTDGIQLFKSREDKDWSLTDCISFVVMRKNSIKKALTSDHHFIQAGFEKLLDIERVFRSEH
ncbi:MAG TPA: PIN domain-containing protein [Desulfotomaculum sp.]|nr:PIN domain-containing protein [Desulfotomaculum sp.]